MCVKGLFSHWYVGKNHVQEEKLSTINKRALLLDLPSESVVENLAHFTLNIKAKLPIAGDFLLKHMVSTSTLVNFTLKV